MIDNDWLMSSSANHLNLCTNKFMKKLILITRFFGEVTEWPNVAVSKTVVPSGTVGSNPTLPPVRIYYWNNELVVNIIFYKIIVPMHCILFFILLICDQSIDAKAKEGSYRNVQQRRQRRELYRLRRRDLHKLYNLSVQKIGRVLG